MRRYSRVFRIFFVFERYFLLIGFFQVFFFRVFLRFFVFICFWGYLGLKNFWFVDVVQLVRGYVLDIGVLILYVGELDFCEVEVEFFVYSVVWKFFLFSWRWRKRREVIFLNFLWLFVYSVFLEVLVFTVMFSDVF